jgi:hypothetical protein
MSNQKQIAKWIKANERFVAKFYTIKVKQAREESKFIGKCMKYFVKISKEV